MTLQELGIPQNQKETLAAVLGAKDQTNYCEISEGTHTFRTGAVMNLQRKQGTQETEMEKPVRKSQDPMDWGITSRRDEADREPIGNQSSQIQSTQHANQQSRQMSQVTYKGELREMVLKSRPNDMTAQGISIMDAMTSDHGFSHRSNFCKPRAPRVYRCNFDN